MARRTQMSVQKRRREQEKAERAANKRKQRAERGSRPAGENEPSVASESDLEGYGILPPREDDAAGSA